MQQIEMLTTEQLYARIGKVTHKPRPRFCDRMKILFDESGMNLSDLSSKIGVPPALLHNWMSGDRTAMSRSLIKICTSLGVSADWLLGLTDERNEPKG